MPIFLKPPSNISSASKKSPKRRLRWCPPVPTANTPSCFTTRLSEVSPGCNRRVFVGATELRLPRCGAGVSAASSRSWPASQNLCLLRAVGPKAGTNHVFARIFRAEPQPTKNPASGWVHLLVPRRGLEPPRVAPLVPETSASTNSAISASNTHLSARLRGRAVSCRSGGLSMKNACWNWLAPGWSASTAVAGYRCARRHRL